MNDIQLKLIALVIFIPGIVFAGGSGGGDGGGYGNSSSVSINMYSITDHATAQSRADVKNAANTDRSISYGVTAAYDLVTGASGYSVGSTNSSGGGGGGVGLGKGDGTPEIIPTADLDCTPNSVQIGEPVTLKWTCTDALSSFGTNFSTGGAMLGYLSVFPVVDTKYTVKCSGTAIYMEASCDVTMGDNTNTNTTTGDTTVTGGDNTNGYNSFGSVGGGTDTSWLDCFPPYITSGESTRLRWNCSDSTGSTLTEITSNTTIYDGTQTNGFEIVQPTEGNNYKLSCLGTSQTFSCNVNVMTEPEVNIQASKALVKSGQDTRITWSSIAATGCTISGPGLSSTTFAGSEVITILGESIFTISCDGNLEDSVKVRVVPSWQEI